MLKGFYESGALSLLGSTLTAATALNPPDLNLPNYNRLPMGHLGALEGGAFIARAHGSEALWYNVGGIARTDGNTISANALLLEFSDIELRGLGTSSETDGFAQIPTFFGTAFDASEATDSNWSWGFAVTTPNSYSQHVKLDQREYDSGTTLTTDSVLDSTFTIKVLQPHLGFAYRNNNNWTLGGSIWLSLATNKSSESLGIRVRDPSYAIRVSQVQFVNGDHESLDLGFSIAGQWLKNENWSFGFSIKTPAIHISDSSSLNLEVTQNLVTETNEISFRDNNIDYEIRYPLTIGFGAAYHGNNWELECDLIYYDKLGNYTVFDDLNQLDLLNYNKITTVSTHANEDLDPVRTDIEQIMNLAIGGHYDINDAISIHMGAYTDLSPVASRNDNVYSKLDMYGVSLGVSRTGDINTSSIGLTYTWGSEDVDVSDSFSAASGKGKIKVNNFAFMFSTSFRY